MASLIVKPSSSMSCWAAGSLKVSAFVSTATTGTSHPHQLFHDINDNGLAYHAKYCIHWKTSLLRQELASHNQPLRCKTLTLCQIYHLDIFSISPNDVETPFQFHFNCSVSKKAFYQIQLVHGASLESSWVVKDKSGVAPKNQLIFDIVMSPLNIMVRALLVSPLKLSTRLQRSLQDCRIKLWTVKHY